MKRGGTFQVPFCCAQRFALALVDLLGFVVRDLGLGFAGASMETSVVVTDGTDISGAVVVMGVTSWTSVIGASELTGVSTESTGE